VRKGEYTGKWRIVILKEGEEGKPKEEQNKKNGRGNKKVKLRIKLKEMKSRMRQ
jgi:hypothetical protein